MTLRSLLDSSATLSRDANGTGDRTRALINDSRTAAGFPSQTTDSIRTWARSLAGVTDQLVNNDPQLRTLLHDGPGFDQGSLAAARPTQTHPAGPAGQPHHHRPDRRDLSSLAGTTARTAPAVRRRDQFLCAHQQPHRLGTGGFAYPIADPPVCTVGFLPPSQWRSPADTTVIDTPDDLYCKLPQDSPIGVRGARNYPCMGHPGKRAPTVEICNSDKPFVPLADAPACARPLPPGPQPALPRRPTRRPDHIQQPESSAPLMEHRCHPDRPGPEERLLDRPDAGRGESAAVGTDALPPYCRTCPRVADGRAQCFRQPTTLRPGRRSRSCTTTRAPVGTSLPMARCSASPTSRERPRPRPGRTCSHRRLICPAPSG